MTADKDKFSGVWNAKRILRTYITIISKKGWKEDLDIRQDQLNAVLKAYSDIAKGFDNERIYGLSCFGAGVFLDPEMSDEQCKEFEQLLQRYIVDVNPNLKLMFENPCQYLDSVGTRFQMFDILLKYRLDVQKLLDHYAGVLECGGGFAIAIYSTKQLYEPKIKESNEIIDELICLLMGKTYTEEIPEWKLIDEYGYPAYTEEELMNMYYENF